MSWWQRNRIPEEYYGETMFFLSADKELVIRIDGEEIYSFGKNNKRLFGHTPGSVYNFVDIPEDCEEGILQMEMVSSYDNYATYLSSVRIADRDVAILRVLKENMFNIVCCLILAFSGILLLVLSLLQRMSRKNEQGMLYLGIVLIWASFYYAIETKFLHIFSGNQTVYSFAVFLFLMYLPILLILYYMQWDSFESRKSFRIVLVLCFCNVILQVLLQVLNVEDFMDMAFLSHILIFVTIMVVLLNYIGVARREGKGAAWLEMAALLFMGGGSVIDLCRTYVITVGDLGKFSRYGTTIYGLIMVFIHIRRLVRNATEEIEENEHFLEKEEQETIYFAGLLHDIGKIRISDKIINKEGRLTEEEFSYIKLHPVSGYHILKGISAWSGRKSKRGEALSSTLLLRI